MKLKKEGSGKKISERKRVNGNVFQAERLRFKLAGCLYKLQATLYVYSPRCAHCKEAVPKLNMEK